MTIDRRVPSATPNQVRQEIAQVLRDSLISESEIRSVYDYRTLPNITAVEVSITTFAAVDIESPVLGYPAYDHILDVRVKHDNTQAGLKAAEELLTDLVRQIWLALSMHSATTFRDVYPYAPTQYPGAPTEVNNIRRAYLYIRAEPL